MIKWLKKPLNFIYDLIKVCFFAVLILLGSNDIAASQPKSLMGRAFFYKDISNFRRPLIKFPILKNSVFVQPFEAKCSNLNRIILPFYIEEENSSGLLTFNLYKKNKEQKLVFSTSIRIEDFPPPKKIGTHEAYGVLHYIWIPPQADSRNKNYLWELKSSEIDEQIKIGLYMNQRQNPKLQPIIIEGIVKENTYAAFYSYCQYRFDWSQIAETTWERFKREKMFLLFYLVLMVGIVFCIRLAKKENADV
tara:strand:+ start:2818 stop:3564 length:747 start_codon:yes stop_codon:yes gene_type:complete